MVSVKKIEEVIGIVLTTGAIISCLLVLLGGLLFLSQHADDNLQIEFLQASIYYPVTFKHALAGVFTFSADAIIEFGLFVLVFTQMIRVGLLVLFYIYQRDNKFIIMSVFIFFLLMYSFIWQK